MLLLSKQTEQILRKMSWLGIGWWIRTRLTTIISHWFRSWSWIWSVICGRMGCLMLSLGSALSTTTLLLRCESLFSLLIVLLPSDEVRIRSYGHRVILIPFIFESCRGTWIVHWLKLFILFNTSKKQPCLVILIYLRYSMNLKAPRNYNSLSFEAKNRLLLYLCLLYIEKRIIALEKFWES